MKKEFIPYQEALDMKELGFDEPCVDYITPESNSYIYDFQKHPDEFIQWTCEKDIIPTPLYQQAFRWFRDEHDLWVEISKPITFLLTISDKRNNKRMCLEDYKEYVEPKSYEEAELMCLKKLIEIVKENE